MNTVLKTLSLAVVGSFITVAGAQAAGFAGASSDTSKIEIKNTSPTNNPHDTEGNEPGIQVTAASGPFAQALLSFKTYQQFAGNDGTIDGYKISTLSTTDMPANHSSLGNFDFAQVPNQDVYFGEWTADRSNPNATRTVYYGGKNKTSTSNLPSSGIVKYDIKGINNFNNSHALLIGSLSVDFANNLVGGRLYNSRLMLKMHDGNVNSNDASFSASASAYSAMSLANDGDVKGHFFGNNAESVAGIATFRNHRDLDTAFGGNKTAPYISGGIRTMSE